MLYCIVLYCMLEIRKKSLIHENADANISCDFGDGEISRSRSRLSTSHIVSSIIVRCNNKSHFASFLELGTSNNYR